ncbi:MAG: hypothetical protein V1701_12015 [Planctomycetota bacterium]
MKIKVSLIVILALIILFIQLFVLNGPEIMGASPDLLIFLVFMASFYSYHPSYSNRIYNITTPGVMLGSWFIGIAKDVVSHTGFGTMGFLYLVSGLLVAVARQLIFKGDIIVQIAILFAVTWICHSLHGFGLAVLYGNLEIWYVIGKSFMVALYTSIIGGIILTVIYKLYWWRQSKLTAP